MPDNQTNDGKEFYILETLDRLEKRHDTTDKKVDGIKSDIGKLSIDINVLKSQMTTRAGLVAAVIAAIPTILIIINLIKQSG